jgi:hypothetical protein
MPCKDPEARRAYNRKWREENRERRNAGERNLYAKNLEKQRTRSREKYLKYREEILARERERYHSKEAEARNAAKRERRLRRIAANPEKIRALENACARRRRALYPEEERAISRRSLEKHRDKRRAADRARAKENPGKMRAKEIKRKFQTEQRTPSWVDMDDLNRIYLARPEGMHVDHIIPLVGKTIEGYRVSGLHVPWNLQYLNAFENLRKLNRMRPEDGITAPLP